MLPSKAAAGCPTVIAAVKKSQKKANKGEPIVYYHDATIKVTGSEDWQYSTVAEVREWIVNSKV